MKCEVICIVKKEKSIFDNIIEKYSSRVKMQMDFSIKKIKSGFKGKKSLSINEQKKFEAKLIENSISNSDYIVLLDENGFNYDSEEFSEFLNKRLISGIKKLVFIIGGPYGFEEKILKKHKNHIALSKMTFPHEMIRLFLIEQIYRSCSILNNTKYHHK